MVWASADGTPGVLLMVEDARRASVWVTLGPSHVPMLEAVLDRLKGLSPAPASATPGHPSSP